MFGNIDDKIAAYVAKLAAWGAALIPDWLVWIYQFPFLGWVALWVGIAFGFVAGKWGWAGASIITAAMFSVFFLARNWPF